MIVTARLQFVLRRGTGGRVPCPFIISGSVGQRNRPPVPPRQVTAGTAKYEIRGGVRFGLQKTFPTFFALP